MKSAFLSRGKIKKMQKNDFPPWGKIKNQQKSTFPREGNQNNSENWLSPAGESQKMLKIVLRGIPKGRKSEKQCFGMPRRVVFYENEPSGSPEARKIWKIRFRGVPKLGKSEKRVLGAPRNMKTMKKDAKSITFRQLPYPEQTGCFSLLAFISCD